MNEIEIKNDRLANIFSQLPQDKLSPLFRKNMMNNIRTEYVRIQKRNKYWSRVGLSFAILFLLIIGGITIWKIDLTIFSTNRTLWKVSLPEFSLYGIIFLLAILLLLLDSFFRKQYRKWIEKRE